MKSQLEALLGLLWVQIFWVRGLEVEQSPSALNIREGANSTLRCNFSATVNSVQWFRQNPGSGLIRLFYIASGTKESGRLTSTANSRERYSTLHIAASQLADSGTYLCAATGNNRKLIWGLGTRLVVNPNIKDPDPAIFQLSSKSNNLSACLFTDYKSNTTLPENAGGDTFISGETVLDMRSMDHKSNGVLAWSTKGNLSCSDVFNNSSLLASSDVPCDAKLVEQSFETDMNLNFQNLSVIGLRVLLLKVVGFNLLMTLRLWSS